MVGFQTTCHGVLVFEWESLTETEANIFYKHITTTSFIRET